MISIIKNLPWCENILNHKRKLIFENFVQNKDYQIKKLCELNDDHDNFVPKTIILDDSIECKKEEFLKFLTKLDCKYIVIKFTNLHSGDGTEIFKCSDVDMAVKHILKYVDKILIVSEVIKNIYKIPLNIYFKDNDVKLLILDKKKGRNNTIRIFTLFMIIKQDDKYIFKSFLGNDYFIKFAFLNSKKEKIFNNLQLTQDEKLKGKYVANPGIIRGLKTKYNLPLHYQLYEDLLSDVKIDAKMKEQIKAKAHILALKVIKAMYTDLMAVAKEYMDQTGINYIYDILGIDSCYKDERMYFFEVNTERVATLIKNHNYKTDINNDIKLIIDSKNPTTFFTKMLFCSP